MLKIYSPGTRLMKKKKKRRRRIMKIQTLIQTRQNVAREINNILNLFKDIQIMDLFPLLNLNSMKNMYRWLGKKQTKNVKHFSRKNCCINSKEKICISRLYKFSLFILESMVNTLLKIYKI